MSASIVIPECARLITVKRPSDDDPAYSRRFKESFRESLKERKQNLKENMFLIVATALDPRYKSLDCLLKSDRKHVWSHITNLAKLSCDAVAEPELLPAPT